MLEFILSMITTIKWLLLVVSTMLCISKLFRINYILPFIFVLLISGFIYNAIFTTMLLCTLAFLLLCEVSTTFEFYARLWSFYLFVMSTALFYIPIICCRPFSPINIRQMQLFWQKALIIFGVSTEIRDSENLEYDKPCVIVCNHQSSIDLIGMMNVMPNRTTILAKKELLYAGPFGIACYLGGLIFVDRANHKSALDTMKWVGNVMLEKNVNIWIFPEGTRNLNGEILPFKKGAFHLAIQAQVPIFAIVNSSYKSFLQPSNHIFKPGKVIVSCLKRFETKGLTISDVDNLMNEVRAKMISVFESTTKEIS